MHSFIVIAKDQQKRKAYVEDFCNKKNIGKFDRVLLEPSENTFGIADVRNLQKTLYLKPNQGKEKVLIIDNAQTITLEAQNALLKLLEEPPLHTFVFLLATGDSFFLPTILSRCKIITLSEEKKIVSEDNIVQYATVLDKLTQGSVGEKLSLAEKIAGDKEGLSDWFEGIIRFSRDHMIADPESNFYPHLVRHLQSAYQLFQTTNVTPRIILEHFFLSV